MRQLTDHKINGLNESLDINVMDEPGSGGANHLYFIGLKEGSFGSGRRGTTIEFQNGPIGEVGFNGLTNESLIAIVIDRMRGFQSGPFKSRDNAIALTDLENALMRLQKRTRDRMQRGVEGTHQP